jgi:hypothetical protein
MAFLQSHAGGLGDAIGGAAGTRAAGGLPPLRNADLKVIAT